MHFKLVHVYILRYYCKELVRAFQLGSITNDACIDVFGLCVCVCCSIPVDFVVVVRVIPCIVNQHFSQTVASAVSMTNKMQVDK